MEVCSLQSPAEMQRPVLCWGKCGPEIRTCKKDLVTASQLPSSQETSRVSIAVIEHYDQKQLGKNSQLVVSHSGKVGQELQVGTGRQQTILRP